MCSSVQKQKEQKMGQKAWVIGLIWVLRQVLTRFFGTLAIKRLVNYSGVSFQFDLSNKQGFEDVGEIFISK